MKNIFRKRTARNMALCIAGTGAAWVGMAYGAEGLKALAMLEKGRWELRERGNPKVRRLCLGDPVQLLQPAHAGVKGCSQFVIANAAGRAAVSYECKGNGTGRTDLRVETPRLVQVYTQGVAGGAPFSLELEGRRVGSCR